MDREKEFNRLYALLDKMTEQQNERQRKTDETLNKSAEQQRKTDETLDRVGKDLDKMKERQESRDEYWAKREEYWAKMEERQKRMDERLGNLGVNIGHRAEDYFFNTLEEIKTFGGVHYDDIQRNVGGRVKGVQDEYDIVLYNGDSVALIETKHKAHPNDVDVLINRKLPNFKKLFPVYNDYKVYLGIATEALSEEVKTKSIENGIGLLVPKGDVIEILDDQLKAY